jgi:hypothetical protein
MREGWRGILDDRAEVRKIFEANMQPTALEAMDKLGSKLKECDNIWKVMSILTENLGAAVGSHLETLLIKDELKERREAAPYSRLDVELLKEVYKGAVVGGNNRLQGIVESMEQNLSEEARWR